MGLQSQQHIVILNTKGNPDHISPELADFLRYVENSTDEVAAASKGDFVKMIHREICKIKADKEQEGAFMTLEDYVDDERLIAFEQGKNREKCSVALNMKQQDFPIDVIVSITGLPLEEVLAL